MKCVMLAIRPKYCEKICHEIGTDKNGKPVYEKTIEVRKTKPSIPAPFKVYIYCTKDKPYLYRVDDDNNFELINTLRPNVDGYIKDYNAQNGKIIGEFICDKTEMLFNTNGNPENYMTDILPDILNKTALSFKEFQAYVGNRSDKSSIHGLHISQLKIYDKPKELSEFRKPLDRVWGSYCNDYCDPGCISFGSTDYSCNDYWDWEKGLTRPPQSWCYVQELEE